MRILLLNSVVGTDFTYAKGAEVDVPDECGKDLIRGGHAILLGGVTKPENPEQRLPKYEARTNKKK